MRTGADPTEELARYIASAREKPLPPAALEATRDHLLDTLAATVSGSRLAAGRIAAEFVRTQGGVREARVVGSEIVTSAINAAWANGMSAHADETDDHHMATRTHPGAAVIPAALAIGERVDASGAHLLRAIALGYDVCVRIGEALGKEPAGEGRNVLSMSGVFGAAAAASSLLAVDAPRTRFVLSYAAQQASGIMSWKRDPDHVEKAFVFGGMPARDGASAALFVNAGCTGVDDVLSGRPNFIGINAPAGNQLALTRDLGSVYEVSQTGIKKWCVGGPVQAPLDGLSALLDEGLSPSEIVRVDVRIASAEAATVDNSKMPDICLQHVLAVLLADGRLTFASSHDATRMDDPAVKAQRARINLIADPSLNALLPRRPVDVVATLRDGTRRPFQAPAVRGSVANPMRRDEVEAKGLDLMIPVLGEDVTRGLLREIASLEGAASVRPLAAALARAQG